MSGRVFGTKKAREYAANNSAAPDVEYPDLPRPLLKLIFETPVIVNRRSETYAVILQGSLLAAEEMAISSWLIREWGDALTNEQFHIAQDLLIFKVESAIQEDMKALKQEQEFTYQNWLNGTI